MNENENTNLENTSNNSTIPQEAQSGVPQAEKEQAIPASSKKTFPKKQIVVISVALCAIIALFLFLIFVVFRHNHDWSQATCTELSRCYDCGETQGTFGSHSYQYGKCSVCSKISDETIEELISTVKSIYGIYWILTFNDDVEIGHSDNFNVEFDTTVITGNKCTVSGTIIVKCKNDKYYTDDFSLHLINKDNDWVKDTDYDTVFNIQPIECYEYGTIAEYHFTASPTYTYNTYKGKAKSTITFQSETCTVKIYDYYGFVDSSTTFEYTIHHGVAWDVVILKGSSEDIELVKMDNGLIWDDMVFLLN